MGVAHTINQCSLYKRPLPHERSLHCGFNVRCNLTLTSVSGVTLRPDDSYEMSALWWKDEISPKRIKMMAGALRQGNNEAHGKQYCKSTTKEESQILYRFILNQITFKSNHIEELNTFIGIPSFLVSSP